MKLGLVMFIIIAVLMGLMAGWTETNLEYWLTMFKGQPVDVPYWMALVLSLITNAFGLAFNIVSEILKMVI